MFGLNVGARDLWQRGPKNRFCWCCYLCWMVANVLGKGMLYSILLKHGFYDWNQGCQKYKWALATLDLAIVSVVIKWLCNWLYLRLPSLSILKNSDEHVHTIQASPSSSNIRGEHRRWQNCFDFSPSPRICVEEQRSLLPQASQHRASSRCGWPVRYFCI